MSESVNQGRRHLLLASGACLCLSLVPRNVYSRQTINFSGKACGLEADVQLRPVEPLPLSADDRRVVAEICAAVGLPANFEIVAIDDPEVNAFATVHEGQRYIVYDEAFMKSIASQQDKDWKGLAVMAHEIGHHLCGHTLDGIGSRPPRELEADTFAGFVVGTLGGALEEVTNLFQQLSAEGSETHPPRDERITAITAGWQKASRSRQPGIEQFNVLSHTERPEGGYARMVSEFVGEDGYWVEFQGGNPIAGFSEGARDNNSVYLFDESRSMWVRIETNAGARVSVASWSPGNPGEIPDEWTPMDPVAWR